MCDRITTLETHLRILGTLSPFAAINFIRKGMGFEEYLREYAQYRKIKPEELSDCKYSVETALELSRIIDEIISARGGAD